jgi:hypothetical protein
MMTRQDFEKIAVVLDANHAPLAIVQDMADMLEEQNERFDRTRFVQASTNQVYLDAIHTHQGIHKARAGK